MLKRAAFFVSAVVVANACVPDADEDFVRAPADVAVNEGGFVVVAVEPGAEVIDVSDGLVATEEDGDLTIVADIGSVGGNVDVSYNCNDVVCIDSIVVLVTPLAWSRTVFTDGPPPREHGAMMASSDGATLFLIGGGGYPNVPTQETLDDAWQFDVASATWSAWPLTGDAIPPGASRRVGQQNQGGGDVAYLHGGYDSAGASLDDVFRVDLTTGVVKRLDQSVQRPAARMLHAMAFDAATASLFVFGGFSTADDRSILADTWKGVVDGDSVTWTELSPPLSPSPRYGSFFGFDPAVRRFVVFSGAGFPKNGDPINAAPDAWSFDVDDETWLDLLPNGEVPPGRRNGCGVVDPLSHNLLVFGGTSDGATTEPGLFLLDVRGDGLWRKLDRAGEPPLRSSSFGAALKGGGVTCGFGNDRDTFQDLFSFSP